MNEIKSKIIGPEYRRGVFVLVKKLSSGMESYFTFKYRSKSIQMFVPNFCLAIFNEIQFANWYFVNLIKELGENNGDDTANETFFILEILDQSKWDFVRKVVLADNITREAVINPCKEDENICGPITSFNLDEYADFNKLKDMFAEYPNTRFNLEINNNN